MGTPGVRERHGSHHDDDRQLYVVATPAAALHGVVCRHRSLARAAEEIEIEAAAEPPRGVEQIEAADVPVPDLARTHGRLTGNGAKESPHNGHDTAQACIDGEELGRGLALRNAKRKKSG